MSYGDQHSRMCIASVGVYVGRILKGAKPADLPVDAADQIRAGDQPQDRKALGLDVPPTLLARADEVIEMKRREFITLLGGAAAAWPLAARAQQPAMPVIGFLGGRSPRKSRGACGVPSGLERDRLCRGPECGDRIPLGGGQYDRLPRSGGRSGSPTGRRDRHMGHCRRWRLRQRRQRSRSSSQRWRSGQVGLVASLDRPGGNVTGVNFFNAELGAKRLELLHELVPDVARRCSAGQSQQSPIHRASRKLLSRSARRASAGSCSH